MGAKWTPPKPIIASVKDVRHLRQCALCGNLGSSLICVSRLSRVRSIHAHGYCLISSEKWGWEAFTRLPSEEMGKLTMSEWKALGIPYARIEAAYEAACEKEARHGKR